jgi:hypothetical protein
MQGLLPALMADTLSSPRYANPRTCPFARDTKPFGWTNTGLLRPVYVYSDMTPRACGYLISRALAVIALLLMVATIVSSIPTDTTIFNSRYSHYYSASAKWSTLAIQVLLCLAIAWLSANLWVHADRFGDLPAKKDSGQTISFKEATNLVLFGLGLYFSAAGISSMAGNLLYGLTRSSTIQGSDSSRLVEAGVRLLFGLAMLTVAKKPKWLTAIVSFALAEYDFEESESDQP